jgi:hypothetical protein
MSFSDIVQRRPWRRGSPTPETVRQLAFEVVMLAAALAGEEGAPVEPERVNAAALLGTARGLLDIASQRGRDMHRELAALRAENAALRHAVETTKTSQGTADALPAPPAISRELIGIADRCANQRDNLDVRWLNSSITRLLEQSGIYPIEDDGEVDPTRHEVIEVRGVTQSDLVNHIAATVRPGYAWRGQILRPQEVVAYVRAESP